MTQVTSCSRRSISRVGTPRGVYVCWGFGGYDGTSQVRDMSPRGLFVLTRKAKAIGAKTNLYFLVEEGQIRADAVVRYVKPGRGLGLEFIGVCDEDRRRLADLLKRVRESVLFSKHRKTEYNQQALLQ
ncbi:MAG TPA: PilZ domain-containing protein [Candidatus Acidoferrum sp.]|nr:PilZ domain-containing protein [Candidatus Acidoferrum sp.]